MKIWRTEPALLMGALQACLSLALTFGVHLTDKQVGGILAASAAILALVTRSQVSPTASAKPPSSGDGRPVGLATGALAALLLLLACSSHQEPPPCDPASYATLAASCGDDEAECDRQISERETLCAKQIQEEP